MIPYLIIFLVLFNFGFCVPPRPTDTLMNDVRNIKDALRELTDEHRSKTDSKFLEDNLVKLLTVATGLDIKMGKLEERAHVWDTFQLHVAAWNDQLSAADRKLDILSKTNEKIYELETKLHDIDNLQFKVDQIFDKISKTERMLQETNNKVEEKKQDENLWEFATRGILSTVKNIERKIDKIDISNQKFKHNLKPNDSCRGENILRDVSSKVDLIFDKFEKDDLVEVGSRDNENKTKVLKEIYSKICTVENKTDMILKNNCKLDFSTLPIEETSTTSTTTFVTLPKSDEEDKPILSKMFCSCDDSLEGEIEFTYDELISRVQTFYCKDGWTVIQQRIDGSENFNKSWESYKKGFGNLHENFWMGNDLIHELSTSNDLNLHIELEDFYGSQVMAEYETFKVSNESELYRLKIGGYSGTASDSFSSHNGSAFSTYDRKNDQAPECCPCALSYGGGWWYNSCFESNLNGLYFDDPHTDDYYKGIIWEYWLGNYSLKKTRMMVKPKETVECFPFSSVYA